MMCLRDLAKRARPLWTRIVGSGSWCVAVNVVACVAFLPLYHCVIRLRLVRNRSVEMLVKKPERFWL